MNFIIKKFKGKSNEPISQTWGPMNYDKDHGKNVGNIKNKRRVKKKEDIF